MEAISDNPARPSGALPATSPLGSDALYPGQKLGRYTLLVPVAQGGMARVWAARQSGQRGFQKIVAIKTIMPALAADPEFERMFLDEARIAAAVHHPNVCEIHDLGEVGDVLFLAMEWVDGISLLTLLKARPRTPLEDPVAVRIVADACAGLHAAHELRDDNGYPLNVVHRDVSPHNILLSINGQVKVADFGVAKAMGLEHAPTVAGQLKGKVAYMSPEQAVGDTTVDRRSDIFSMGAVLYEALTGYRAWAGANDVARLQNLLAGNIIPPKQVRPDIPQDLENILAYSLAIDPARRYQTAEQMRMALEKYLVSRSMMVSASNVANSVRMLCGREIEIRQAQIRQAAAAIPDETMGMPGASVEPYSVQYRSRGMRRSTATAITFVAGGITIAGIMGIVAVSSLPSAPAATPPTVASNPPTQTASLAPPPPQNPNIIVVRPSPSDAEIEVNHVILGKGVRSFDRPEPGQTHTVVVRAPGFETATLTINHDATESEWSVELTPSPDAAASAVSPPRDGNTNGSTHDCRRPPTTSCCDANDTRCQTNAQDWQNTCNPR
ncbi:MAG TPA: protein kinase [Polyangiaceae bacterium]|nr:protein kinase [Polyangiaceae bacterium]